MNLRVPWLMFLRKHTLNRFKTVIIRGNCNLMVMVVIVSPTFQGPCAVSSNSMLPR